MKPCMRRVCHEFPVACDSEPGQTVTKRWKTKFGASRRNSDLWKAASVRYCCGDGSGASTARDTDCPHWRRGGTRRLVSRDTSESATAQNDRCSDRSISVVGVRYASRRVLLRLGRASGHVHDLHPGPASREKSTTRDFPFPVTDHVPMEEIELTPRAGVGKT